jgi:signal transduction histidine kinase
MEGSDLRQRAAPDADGAGDRSWMLLATGVTALDKLVSEELARDAPDDQRVYQAAAAIVREVIPSCDGCVVHRSAAGATGGPRLYPITSVRDGDRRRLRARSPAFAVLRSGQQFATADPAEITRDGLDAGWLTYTPIHIGGELYGVLAVCGKHDAVPANAPQVCEIVADQLGLYLHLRRALSGLQKTRGELQATTRAQSDALEDLEHQLGGPLRIATERVELIIHSGRLDGRMESHLRAVRGLCRKATRVALSAGVFAALSKGAAPAPKLELLSADDLLRLLIAGADDAQLLSNPRRRIRFEVDRDRIRQLGRRLVRVDRSFVEQCVGNVLDNAAKYSYEDVAVEIGGDASDDTFAVTVTSVGLPLSLDEARATLRRNWRGPHARAATGEGSGLGLWIADHLMRSMNGTIRVEPVGDATTVRLTFPIVTPTPKGYQ